MTTNPESKHCLEPADINVCKCFLLLRDQREGLGTDGGAGYQTDGDAAERSGVVNTHDCVKRCADGVDVGLLAVLVPSARVQDVPSVQNQYQDVDLGSLQTLLRRTLLRDGRIAVKVMHGECFDTLLGLSS